MQREYAWQSGVFAQGLTPRRTCTWEQDGKADCLDDESAVKW
jgi:hypothetical protein